MSLHHVLISDLADPDGGISALSLRTFSERQVAETVHQFASCILTLNASTQAARLVSELNRLKGLNRLAQCLDRACCYFPKRFPRQPSALIGKPSAQGGGSDIKRSNSATSPLPSGISATISSCTCRTME